ncbi:hypothetical protein PsYK624_060320 [Phanerochaete sordida]|uniref:Uncharacterized protein n=1 Tax=Phanerochaete sordida TaxID=48140 RepID=A0A9P3LC62_9APHY|nr:hypothetical protein PsYK624_060320 [Phanerochaete sordida]
MSSNVKIPISSFIVEDWFNGLYTATMLGTLWVIAYSGHFEGLRKKYHMALVVFMYICSTMHSSLQWFFYAGAINANEGTDGTELVQALTHLAPWLEITGDTFFCLNIFIADCLFIWRCWVVWQRRWIIVILPICATIAGAVLAGFVISVQADALESNITYVAVQKEREFTTLITAYFTLSISTSLTTTLLISLRVLLVQRAARSVGMEKYSAYTHVVEILVESAALYSATLLVFVVLNTRMNINFYYAQNIHAQIAGLTPTLIILRVAAGKSRRDEEWSTSAKVESLQFAARSGLSQASSSLQGHNSDPEMGFKAPGPALVRLAGVSEPDSSSSEGNGSDSGLKSIRTLPSVQFAKVK